MNLVRLKRELGLIVDNSALEASYKDWLNDAVLEIASDFELPDLRLIEPVIFHIKDDEWLYDLPKEYDAWVTATSYVIGDRVEEGDAAYECILGHTAGAASQPGTGASWATYWVVLWEGLYYYHKKLFAARNGDDCRITIHKDIQRIIASDPDHDETDTYVSTVGVQDNNDGGKLATYPMCDDELSLWFYRLPTPMDSEDDEPEGIPAQFHAQVLIPKVVVQNFEIINSMAIKPLTQNIAYWHERLRLGLYGEPRGQIGLINFLAKGKSTRTHGGSDPLGGSTWLT